MAGWSGRSEVMRGRLLRSQLVRSLPSLRLAVDGGASFAVSRCGVASLVVSRCKPPSQPNALNILDLGASTFPSTSAPPSFLAPLDDDFMDERQMLHRRAVSSPLGRRRVEAVLLSAQDPASQRAGPCFIARRALLHSAPDPASRRAESCFIARRILLHSAQDRRGRASPPSFVPASVVRFRRPRLRRSLPSSPLRSPPSPHLTLPSLPSSASPFPSLTP
ncbi:uncharacterized protein SCHCODRAFT_02045975 [Schizophyllum commune H4-8]|uniref:uncharacterized protein n=1 Tax=Schizophyllum commune (strain H4-8 / FGSC 9210) TaxID=578458 RepID=UPI0021608400|nr:uncharacterized protein SCHCODRAFT_02045975 [Schizophyllum commune H4-8]KAI5888118.1 hypothetical protein SCHCODRAFT_02045975 [Schizophyllum commune H4-8]